MGAVGAAGAAAVVAAAAERAACAAQAAADGVRPPPFSSAEDRAPWAAAEDQARGAWRARNRRAAVAATLFLRQARVNGAG